MIHLLQICGRLRLAAPCWRSFSSLQVKNGVSFKGLQKQSVNRIFVRCKLIATRKQRKFRPQYAKDKISKDFELIYENNMNRWIFWGQICMYALTVPALVGSAWIVFDHISDIPWKLSVSNPATTALVYLGFGTALLLFVNVVSRRSIQRIYFNPQTGKYVAVIKKWMTIPQNLEFTLQDAKSVTPSLSKFMIGNLQIKKKVFFVVGTDFRIPKHFNNFMGWEEHRSVEYHELDVIDFVKKPEPKPKLEQKNKLK